MTEHGRNMKKRIISALIALTLIFSLIPINALAAGPTEVLSVFVASDRHGNDTYLKSVLNVVKSAGYSKLKASVLIGDTFDDGGSSSDLKSVSSTIQGIIGSGVSCYYTYGSHDENETSDYLTGAADLGYAYLYGISYDQMKKSSTAATAAAAFTTWVNTLPSSNKPIIVLSHMPIHKRRGDNKGGATWLAALNSAGTSHNILFLWAHNHTGESSTDTAVYYVAKGGKITAQGNSSATTINFSYMNAGYLKYSSSSGKKSSSSKSGSSSNLGYGSVITMYSDGTIAVKKYSTSALYSTNTISSMVSSVTVDSLPNKVKYIQNEESLDLTGGVIRLNFPGGFSQTLSMTASDVTVTGFDNSQIGTQTLNLSISGKSTTFNVVVYGQNSCADISQGGAVTNGTVGINVTLDILDSVADNSNTYALITNNETGEISKVPVSAMDYNETTGKYELNIQVSAKSLTDTISVRLFTGDTARSSAIEYSVSDYIDLVTNPDNAGASWNSEGLINLCKNLGNYGTAFQNYFNYRIDSPANTSSGFTDADRNPESVSTEDLEAYKILHDGQGDVIGISNSGISLVMESEIITRVFYELEEGHSVDEFEFYIDGELCTPEVSGNQVVVSFYSAPADFGTSSEIRVVDKDSNYTDSMKSYRTISVSPISYLNQLKALDDESYEELIRACEWIYRYYIAARNYAGSL